MVSGPGLLSVGVGSVGGVIGIETELLAPGDFLGNAAFARTLIGHYQAIELEQLAAYAATVTDEVEQGFMPLEVSTLLHISDRAAERRIRFAAQLVSRLPRTLAMLKQGWIEEFKAQLIAEAVEPLSDDHALAVEARVLDRAPAQTPTQLRTALAKAVLVVDPLGAEQRRRERVRGRRVEARPTEDGMAMLTVHHTAERIAQAHSVIIARARELKALGGEQRTLAQLEADVAANLLLGKDCGGRVVEVHLTVPASTLLGQDDQPGEVDGLPVPARAARELAAEALSWRWVRTDPDTGQLVDLTYRSYQPPKVLADLVKIRDRTCRYPGCTRRARSCDVDHRVPWPLGATCDDNCACLCRTHHRAKHEGGWKLEQIKPGWFKWTSPLGFTHVVPPDPVTEPQPPPPAAPTPDPPPF
jgi:uncharacterized protein DUF222